MLTVNSSKTFDEILVEKPNLYSGIISYTWSTDQNKWVQTSVPETTKALIEEWFGLRNVCDDDHFERFFRRKMNGTALRFAQLKRIELSAFDPLVANYIEREEISSSTGSHSITSEESGSKTATSEGTSTNSKSGEETTENTNVSDPQVVEFTTSTRTPDLTETNTTSGTSSETHSEDAKDVQVNKSAPMSIEYAGATAGNIPNLNWGTLSAQQQAEHEGGSTQSGTTSGSESRTSTGTEDNESKKWSTGVDTVTDNGGREWSETDSGTNSNESSESTEGSRSESGTNSDNRTVHTIDSGRSGLTPQEAFSSAVAYLKTSSAFAWLRGELEECFMSVYDI